MAAHAAARDRRDQMEQAVTRFFNMANTHCLANLAPLMTNNVEMVGSLVPEGLESVNTYFGELWDVYPCLTFSVENVIIEGNSAVAEVSVENGPSGRNGWAAVMTFQGSLVRRIKFY